ncbi:MAG: hypothetical protein JWR74_1998 [Polaromonas sp.]|jgi:hypothetical protein|nr:hypothetical protein [Polaromonas sp.]
MSAPETPQEPSARVVFDLKIPLWGVISACCAGMALFASLYFSVQALTEAVKDLQITVKTGNTSVMTLQSEQSLIKFRIGTAESDILALKAALASNTKGLK